MFIKRSTKDPEVKGAVRGRSKITSEEGRVTGVELFPFPKVIAKYGHERNMLEIGIFQLYAEIVPSVVWIEVH